MSEKNKRAEELLFGKERMTFAEIMQSMEACAKINCEKCALHAIIDGWSQADLPDCSTVLMKNATDTLLEYYNKLRTPEPAVNAKAEERHEECSSKVEGYLDSCPVCPNCNYIFDEFSISEEEYIQHFPFGGEDRLDLKKEKWNSIQQNAQNAGCGSRESDGQRKIPSGEDLGIFSAARAKRSCAERKAEKKTGMFGAGMISSGYFAAQFAVDRKSHR